MYLYICISIYYEYFQKNNDKGPDDNLKEDDNMDQIDAIIQGKWNGMGFIRSRRKAVIIRFPE